MAEVMDLSADAAPTFEGATSGTGPDAALREAPRSIVPDEPLIGFGGREQLRAECIPHIEKGTIGLFDFVREFQEKHTLREESCESMMGLLDLGGFTRTRVERMMMSVLTEYFKKKIPELSQDQLEQLLDKSYSYLTVPELKPISIAVLEKFENVPEQTWLEIVHNGLQDAPYVDMPLTIKRKIWQSRLDVFSWEIDQALKDVVDHQDHSQVNDYMMVSERAKIRDENTALANFHRLLGTNDTLLVGFIDKMVESAAITEVPAKRVGLANIFHDVLATLAARFMPNVERLRVMAKHVDKGGVSKEITLDELNEIRVGLSENASCGPVTLLCSSSYTRDLIIETLVSRLVTHKPEKFPQGPEEVWLRTLANKLQRDQMLEALTYICLTNLASLQVLSANAPLEGSTTLRYFSEFYPRLVQLIWEDDDQLKKGYFEQNVTRANDFFLSAVRDGALERRVLCGYGLMLFAHNNLMALAKLRLVLDQVVISANPGEEKREMAIAEGLIVAATDF